MRKLSFLGLLAIPFISHAANGESVAIDTPLAGWHNQTGEKILLFPAGELPGIVGEYA